MNSYILAGILLVSGVLFIILECFILNVINKKRNGKSQKDSDCNNDKRRA